MRFRRALLPLLVLAPVLVAADPARAGGSWLEPDRRAYVPGDVATFRGSFSTHGALEGTLADGPFVAYLLRLDKWIVNGRIPEGAIRLGEIGIVREPNGFIARGVVTFTVPTVPKGWYHLGYCNDPCTVDGIGDLVGGMSFVVAPTRAEGGAMVRIARLDVRADIRQRVVARTREERQRLERALEARSEALHLTQARVSELETELVDARSSLAGPVVHSVPAHEPSVTWWIALLAGLPGSGPGSRPVAGARSASSCPTPCRMTSRRRPSSYVDDLQASDSVWV